jgi:hypothetical protein
MRFNTPAPEDIVRWYRKGVPGGGQKDRIFDRLKAKLTGGTDDSGTSYFKMHDRSLTQHDADYLINNMKKDEDGYPMLETGSTSGEAERRYQEWLIERYLEVPFREQTNEKIRQAEVRTKVKEIIKIDEETAEVAPVVEEAPQLVAVVEDKIDALEAIREEIAPPRSEYQPPEDPWGEGTIPPKVEATVKKTKKKAKKRKSRKSAPEASKPKPQKPFATKMGGSVGKTGQGGAFNSVLSFMERTSVGAGEGPSVLAIGAAFGRKVQTAFDEAKDQKERALEAEANGAELPPEVKEKGYFLKKSLGYQFGGQAYDQTLGAFLENMPSKQSKKKAGFSSQFDYGDADPATKKRQDSIKDLASGFRRVSRDLRKINSSLNENLSVQTSLLGEQSRIADTLEQIQNAIAGLVGIEIDSGNDAASAAGGDINVGDINLRGKKGFDLFGAIFGAVDAIDDVFDIIRHLRGGKKGLGNQNGLYRRLRKGGMPNLKRPRMPKMPGGPPRGKFGMLKTVLGGGLQMLSEGGTVKMAAGGVPAMVGEAGPEMIVPPGGSGLPELTNNKDLQKLAQPFANVMQVGLQVQGAQIAGAMSQIISAAGPFSGLIAKMFLPMVGGLSSIFGIKAGSFEAQMKSASMTVDQGAKQLLKFFAPFMGLFGIGSSDAEKKSKSVTPPNMLTGPMKQKAKQFAEYLMSKHGLSDFQAAGIVGVMMQEGFGTGHSDVREGGQRGAPTYNGTRQEGYGWVQWTNTGGGGPNDRLNRALIHLGMGPPPKETRPWSDGDNIKVMEWEWQNYYPQTIPSVKKASTLEEAVYEFTGNYTAGSHANIANYESQEGGGFLDRRNRNAAGVLQSLQASRGVSASAKFMNNTEGIYKMTGPDTGYSVPMYLTGGTAVTGHGEEYLIKRKSKFLILPTKNRDYDVYANREKAYDRYAQIGNKGGVNVAGMLDTMDKLLFGMPEADKPMTAGASESGSQTATPDTPMSAGTRQTPSTPPQSSLPMGTVTPVAMPKDTATGTVGNTVVAVQPMIQYIPVPGPVQTVVEEVPTNPFVAARKSSEMLYLQGLS